LFVLGKNLSLWVVREASPYPFFKTFHRVFFLLLDIFSFFFRAVLIPPGDKIPPSSCSFSRFPPLCYGTPPLRVFSPSHLWYFPCSPFFSGCENGRPLPFGFSLLLERADFYCRWFACFGRVNFSSFFFQMSTHTFPSPFMVIMSPSYSMGPYDNAALTSNFLFFFELLFLPWPHRRGARRGVVALPSCRMGPLSSSADPRSAIPFLSFFESADRTPWSLS